MGKVWKSRDIPCRILDNTSDGIEGWVEFELLILQLWNWDTELEIGNCFDAKNPARIFLKKLQTSHCVSGTFWKTHWIQSVEGNIWSSTALQSHSVNLCELRSSLRVWELKWRFSPSQIEKMHHGTDNKVFDVMKVEFRFRLLFCFVVSTDVVHFYATKPLKMSIPLRLEAKRAKNSDPTSALRSFLGDFSVCFGCQMSFPPFTVEKWIRIVDSFQIFLPKSFGIIFCIFENRFFLVPNCKSERMHYHWQRFFRRAATSMTFVMFRPLRAKVGYIFSTDQSTNPGPFNTKIQKLSVFLPCQRFKDDFRCKHLKSEMCRYDFATSWKFLEGNKLKYVGERWIKGTTCPWREQDQKEWHPFPDIYRIVFPKA